MAKAILTLGYTSYVMDTRDALAIAEMLGKAELYETKYAKGSENTHHIYENEKQEIGILKLISDSFYQLAKLAGQPVKD